MSVPLLKRRFTVDEYHRMAEAGIFSEDDRVELIDGEIVEMTAIGSRHAACVNRLIRLLSDQFRTLAVVSAQNPVRLGTYSEPQPDLALLRPRADFYASAHPGPGDTLLVIEVAETSLPFDRQIKLPLYARTGVPEVWIANLSEEAIEVHRQPSPDGYRDVSRRTRGEHVSPAAFPDVTLAVAEILG